MTYQEEVEYYREVLNDGMRLISAALNLDAEHYDRDQADGACYLDCFKDAAEVITQSGIAHDKEDGEFLVRSNEEGKTNLTLALGRELFRFDSEQQWVNNAKSWFASKAPEKGNYISVDLRGRVCTRGAHFMRATSEKTYPIVVYVLTV